MILQLQAIALLIGSQFSSASNVQCSRALENTHKKLITQFIYKDPFSFGKDVEVEKVETVLCPPRSTHKYLVTYTDIICHDLNDPKQGLVKCYRIRCNSPAKVSTTGSVDFELAPPQSCDKSLKEL